MDPLIAEIESIWDNKERERKEKAAAKAAADEALPKEVGPCPSLLDAIPKVERAYVEWCADTERMEMTMSFTSRTSPLKTDSYENWRKRLELAINQHKVSSMDNISTWAKEEIVRVLEEFVVKWTELHPQITCIYVPSGIYAIGELLFEQKNKRSKSE